MYRNLANKNSDNEDINSNKIQKYFCVNRLVAAAQICFKNQVNNPDKDFNKQNSVFKPLDEQTKFEKNLVYLQGDSAKCAQILFLVLCTCISSIINFQLLTFQFLII